MSGGMRGLDSYLTQSDDVTWDRRITDERVRCDALDALDLQEGIQLDFGREARGIEHELTLDTVAVTDFQGAKHWVVTTEELAFPLLIPIDETTWFDFL